MPVLFKRQTNKVFTFPDHHTIPQLWMIEAVIDDNETRKKRFTESEVWKFFNPPACVWISECKEEWRCCERKKPQSFWTSPRSWTSPCWRTSWDVFTTVRESSCDWRRRYWRLWRSIQMRGRVLTPSLSSARTNKRNITRCRFSRKWLRRAGKFCRVISARESRNTSWDL